MATCRLRPEKPPDDLSAGSATGSVIVRGFTLSLCVGHGTLELNPADSSGYRTFAPYDSYTHNVPCESHCLLLTARPDNDPDEISFALKERRAEARGRNSRPGKRLRANEITPLCCRRQSPELERENEFLIRHGRSSNTEILDLRV